METMTESKHTPGPWAIFTQGNDVEIKRASSTGLPLEQICTINAKIFANEGEYNARLIAAAPETAAERDRLKEINKELVEALEWSLPELRYQFELMEWPNEKFRSLAFIKLIAAESILSKAKGQ